MKHIKKFESLVCNESATIKVYNELNKYKRYSREDLLVVNGMISDSDFKIYAEMFDNIVDIFIEYYDLGYEIKFATAYGRRVEMSYYDYVDKKEKYKEFINGLPIGGLFFSIDISMPYEFENFINILNSVNSNSKRLEEMDDLVIKSFQVRGNPLGGIAPSPFISISYDFEEKSV
jgi:hypothetical protein